MESALPDDRMVIVAALVSRVEALVVASMLEAAGIFVHIGGPWHASVQVNFLVLGGHRLWVPSSQHRAASEIMLEVLGEEEWGFSNGLRKAVLKFLALWCGINAIQMAVAVARAGASPLYLLATPLWALGVPVNPQGRGDYFLAEDADHPAD